MLEMRRQIPSRTSLTSPHLSKGSNELYRPLCANKVGIHFSEENMKDALGC